MHIYITANAKDFSSHPESPRDICESEVKLKIYDSVSSENNVGRNWKTEPR